MPSMATTRTDKTHEHVPLRIPGISLGAQKVVSFLAEDHCSRPFDEFVPCADRHGHADRKDGSHAPVGNIPQADQDLPRRESRHESLKEVADPVVVVAAEQEQVLHPEPQGNARVGVRAAGDQDDCVQKDENIEERGQGKSAIGQ